MNRERAKGLLPIIQAFAEGKEIEYLSIIDKEWLPCDEPLFGGSTYRIKPEPREFWVGMPGHKLHCVENLAREGNYQSIIHLREVLDD